LETPFLKREVGFFVLRSVLMENPQSLFLKTGPDEDSKGKNALGGAEEKRGNR